MPRMSRIAFQDLVNTYGVWPRHLVNYADVIKERTWIDCFQCENSFVTHTGSSRAACKLCNHAVVYLDSDHPDKKLSHLIEKCPIGSYKRRN